MGDSINSEAVPPKPAFNLTEVDKWILEQTDDTFKKHDWEDLRKIIGEHSWRGASWHCSSPQIFNGAIN